MSDQLDFLVESVKEIKEDMKDFIKSQANQDTKLALLDKDAIELKEEDKTLHRRISNHESGHWKWIAVVVGLLAIIEGIRKLIP